MYAVDSTAHLQLRYGDPTVSSMAFSRDQCIAAGQGSVKQGAPLPGSISFIQCLIFSGGAV